jgi:hypothetical protein
MPEKRNSPLVRDCTVIKRVRRLVKSFREPRRQRGAQRSELKILSFENLLLQRFVSFG